MSVSLQEMSAKQEALELKVGRLETTCSDRSSCPSPCVGSEYDPAVSFHLSISPPIYQPDRDHTVCPYQLPCTMISTNDLIYSKVL